MDHISVGKKGEDVATKFLKNKGHTILDRNFRKKYGEIDIVSKLGTTLYFVEVKTMLKDQTSGGFIRPEDNATPWKLKKLSRVVSVYLEEKCPDGFEDWSFLVVAVHLDLEKKIATVRLISDVL